MSKARHVLVYWYDIETNAGWGKGNKQPPLCIDTGFVIEAPNKKQKVRCWRISGTVACGGEYGNATIIPEGVVKRVVELGRVRRPKR